VRILDRYVGYSDPINTRTAAGAWGLSQAIKKGLLQAGDRYEVDVSEDASDDWETVLSGVVP
jgi:hypothetical protein